jgi:ATP-binding cassette subfamily B protein
MGTAGVEAGRHRAGEGGVVADMTRGRRGRIAGVAVSSFAAGTLEALFLVLVTRTALAVTDGSDVASLPLLGERDVSWGLWIAPALIAARVLLSVLTAWQEAQLSEVAVSELQQTLTSAFLSSSWDTQRRVAANLQQLVSTFSGAARTVLTSVARAVSAGANLAALSVLAFLVDPVGASIVVGAVVVLAVVLAPLRARIRRNSAKAAEHSLAFATTVAEISQLGVEVQTFRVGHAVDNKLHALVARSRRAVRKVQFLSGLTTPIYTGLAYLGLVAALAIIASISSSDTGSLAASLLVMLRSLSYGQALQGSWAGVSSAAPQLEVLRARLNELRAGARRQGGRTIDRVGVISAESVTLEYEAGERVLHDVTFTVQPGETIGIVGPSGGGKTSLVQLILALREPTSGSLMFNGFDIREIDLDVIATKVAIVPQGSNLITGTVAENIRFFRTDLDDAQVERSAHLAHIHDDIVKLPGGYSSQVGPQGGHLSGGQKQRICIARALASQPEVLVLDEPTSALDVRSEHAIRTTLSSLRGEVTVIVIAHRLSTLDICDRIMVIQEGQLTAFDTPARLAGSAGFYSDALRLSGLH